MGWQTQSVVQLFAGDTIINPSGSFTYSSSPAAGNLIASQAPASGTDTFGNNYLQGVASYGPGFAAQLGSGFVTLYTGSLAAGWTAQGTIETSVTGGLFLNTASGIVSLIGTAVSTNTNTLDDGAGNMTVSGKLAINGGTAMPNTTANPGHQSAAPATYSQSYENATTNRLNDILDILAASRIWPF